MPADLLETVEDLRARLEAQEFVLKIVLNVLSQLAPNAGLQPAMQTMLRNSVAAAILSGDDPIKGERIRALVLKHGEQIMEAAFEAKPAA